MFQFYYLTTNKITLQNKIEVLVSVIMNRNIEIAGKYQPFNKEIYQKT